MACNEKKKGTSGNDFQKHVSDAPLCPRRPHNPRNISVHHPFLRIKIGSSRTKASNTRCACRPQLAPREALFSIIARQSNAVPGVWVPARATSLSCSAIDLDEFPVLRPSGIHTTPKLPHMVITFFTRELRRSKEGHARRATARHHTERTPLHTKKGADTDERADGSTPSYDDGLNNDTIKVGRK